jgi:N-acetyl-gamma-glutamyl-phosphate reductase
MVTCSVIGATSYTGNELIRLLAQHPRIKIGCLTTRSEESLPARDMIPSLPKSSDLTIEQFNFKKVLKTSDVVFLALPHTSAMKFGGNFFDRGKVVIDLSADFRLKNVKIYEKWYQERHTRKDLLKKAVYGLPEIYREEIRKANLIANPGCYPTGTTLGIYPLLKNDLVDTTDIVVDAKSGVSGAGKKLSAATQYCEANENFSAYKVNRHQHSPEIEQTLSGVAKAEIKITFVPHLLPVNRGILATIYLKRKAGIKTAKIMKAFEAFAENEPFVRFLGLDKFPSLRNVQFTNFCDIGVTVDESKDRIVVVSVIDNLIKGASGQAIQNMNIRFGFPETAGLLGTI